MVLVNCNNYAFHCIFHHLAYFKEWVQYCGAAHKEVSWFMCAQVYNSWKAPHPPDDDDDDDHDVKCKNNFKNTN